MRRKLNRPREVTIERIIVAVGIVIAGTFAIFELNTHASIVGICANLFWLMEA